MISLATSTTSTRISPEATDARPAGDASAAKDAFSAVLALQGLSETEPKGENSVAKIAGGKAEVATASESVLAALVGISLPEAAEGGKELPVLPPVVAGLPPVAADGAKPDALPDKPAAEPAEGTSETAATEAALAILAAPQVPLLAAPVAAPADETAQACNSVPERPLAARPAPAVPVPTPITGEPTVAVAGTAKPTPQAAAAALQVGPAPVAPTAPRTSANIATDDQAGSDAPAPKSQEMALDRPAPWVAAAETTRPQDLPVAAVSAPSITAPAVPAVDGPRPNLQADALRELTQMVDRLAAAREVFAPAMEALAIEHAEFGELSLRFDQRRDGGLSVQLSASNPDAHRAVAQAVSAQAFQSSADDRASAGQPQSQAQTPGRSGASDREASGNGNAARHEQPAAQHQQRRSATQQQPADSRRQRAGVFA